MNVAENNRSKRTWRLPAAWTALIVFDLCLVALAYAQDAPTKIEQPEVVDSVVVQIEGPNDVALDDERFEAIDIFVDAGDEALAAYQFELESRTPGVEIVGVEGGEHSAFSKPPYYDSKAIRHNRVIIAAFHAGRNLPAGKSRVARIHVMLQGPGAKEYETKLTVSATVNGVRIPAEASVRRAKA